MNNTGNKSAQRGVSGKPPVSRKGATLLSTILIFICGCTHYHLGPPAELPFRTLHVEMVANKSTAPQAQALLTRNLTEAFLRDGRLSIVNEDQAEATLSVTLSGFDRRLAATEESDTVLGRSFNLTLEAAATLVDNGSGKIYFKNRKLAADEIAYADGGLNQAEYQAMPLLARNLAAKIKDSVVNTW